MYYLKDSGRTLVGRAVQPDEPGNETQPDIQLQGFGIADRHCIIELDSASKELRLVPLENARTCVNGAQVTAPTVLKHGDRIVWGHHHFFKLSCPGGQRPRSAPTPTSRSSVANANTSITSNRQSTGDTANRTIDFEFAREELLLNSEQNPQLELAVKSLEQQHEQDKQRALEKQRAMYERQLQMLRNAVSPGTPYAPYGFDQFGSRTNLSNSTLSIAGNYALALFACGF